jgi:hypothetical protein
MTLNRLRWTRRGVALVVALDLLALVGAAFHRTTAITTTSLSAPMTPAPGAPAAAPSTEALPTLAPLAPAPVRTGTAVEPVTSAAPSPRPTASPVPTYSVPAQPTPAACPLPLQSPSSNGGLQSLISYAPAFGPFISEAFAPAAAYAPVLTLVGPVLAQYPTAAPVIEPLLLPLLDSWVQVLEAGYAVVGPFYSPYREQFIEAETELANALAPYSQSLASSLLASCVINLQYTLIAQAPKP